MKKKLSWGPAWEKPKVTSLIMEQKRKDRPLKEKGDKIQTKAHRKGGVRRKVKEQKPPPPKPRGSPPKKKKKKKERRKKALATRQKERKKGWLSSPNRARETENA